MKLRPQGQVYEHEKRELDFSRRRSVGKNDEKKKAEKEHKITNRITRISSTLDFRTRNKHDVNKMDTCTR